MNIGETALASGISVKMIRHYEAIGLVPPAARTQGGYRCYDDDALGRLIFIRHARAVGFATPQIRRLLSLWDDDARAPADLVRLAEEHLQHVRARIGELQDIAGALRALIARADDAARPSAPRIESATRAGQAAVPRQRASRARTRRVPTARAGTAAAHRPPVRHRVGQRSSG